VLSPRSYNSKVELCIVCPITGQAKGYPFEVALPGNLPITGVVLVDQVKCLSWARRNADFACLAPADVERHVKAKLKALLRL
jgi:mRNA interferase MazF